MVGVVLRWAASSIGVLLLVGAVAATPAPVVTAPPAGTALTITGVSASGITSTGATVTWTASAPATGQVEYGTTTAYGLTSALESSYNYSTHIQTLSGLTPGTLYHYRTHSVAADGRSAYSGDYTFRTLAPTATPAPTGGIAVPATIDATGGSDASAALISFLATVPDGSTIVFKAGGVYRMDAGLAFSNRHRLTFEGNGATLKSNGGISETSSLFFLRGGNTDITIRNFKLVGNSSTPGVYQGGREFAHGVLAFNSSNVEIVNVTISAVWGDGVLVDGSDTVRFHDSHVVSAGRNGFTVLAGNNITVERVAFDKSGYCTFDIEPWLASGVATNIKFLNNTAGTWTNSFLSAEGVAGSVVRDVTVSGNRVTGGSLRTAIALSRRQNIVFTNNTSTVAAGGPVLSFAHIDGLTVTGNVQPLSWGSLASITDCTGVVYQP